MNHWVHDYETLTNCFVACFEDYKTDELKTFVVHDLRNDFESFIKFLKSNIKNKEWHISYNGLAFDGQVTHHILNNYKKWKHYSGCKIANLIFQYASICIAKSNAKDFQDYPLWKMKIGQIDLYKMHHWDNPAKRSSLKWIQYSMDWQNILDMPIHHDTKIQTNDEIDTIIKYCINDVKSTKAIYQISTSEIKLRKTLTKKYNINLYSASEPRISKEIFGYYLSKRLDISKKDLKKMRTHRSIIKLKDVILPYIEFKSPEFKGLLEKFKSLELDPANLKGSFKHHLHFKGCKIDFGLGGVHGANVSGVYESDDKNIIMSSDVTSFYPNLSIRNGWSPGHFPSDVFCELYEWFFNERRKIPKSNPMNYVYKIILNSTFGLSNDVNSFFYDPQLCMQITINGQLSLMMVFEDIMLNIPNAVPIMQNTDGFEIKIPKQYIEKYMEICKNWEQKTKLELEHDSYQKIVFGDVNNYIGLNEYQYVEKEKYESVKQKNPHYLFKVEGDKYAYASSKLKGRFNFHNLALHKNKSKLVVKKGVYHYFINNKLPEIYLNENVNILDYCIGAKSKGQWKQEAWSLKGGVKRNTKLQKTNRYYVCDKRHENSVKIIKKHSTDDRIIQLESSHWMQCLYNVIEEKTWDSFNVDKGYYLSLINSEINKILNKSIGQMDLLY